MTNPRTHAAYHRATVAFSNPTLDLLHGRYAPFVVAALSLVFTADRPTVSVSQAHIEVGDIVEELRTAGYESLPVGTGREICRYWIRVGWLIPHIASGDTEIYRLSAQAVSALEIAGRTGGGRARVSRSRVRTLLDSIDQLVSDAETDPQRRIAALQAEREVLDAQIRKLQRGDVDPVDDEQLREEAENVLHLARELPADFVQVAESITQMQRDVVTELRRDIRPAAEVLREYLHRGHHIMESTPEGRAFAGALKFIGDSEHIDHLTEQLHALLDAPFAQTMGPEQRRDLIAVASHVEQGVAEVLTAQRAASHVITAQVRTHDPARDREVDDLLRSVMSGLQTWMQTTGGRGGDVEPLRRFPTATVNSLRRSLNDLQPPGIPAPLHHAEDAPEYDLEETRAWGGPRYEELEETVAKLSRHGVEHFDLASLFTQGDEDARRPVDLLGLPEIAHRFGMAETEGVSVVEARRPDGAIRRFAFGGVTASTEEQKRTPERTDPTDE